MGRVSKADGPPQCGWASCNLEGPNQTQRRWEGSPLCVGWDLACPPSPWFSDKELLEPGVLNQKACFLSFLQRPSDFQSRPETEIHGSLQKLLVVRGARYLLFLPIVVLLPLCLARRVQGSGSGIHDKGC